MRLVYLPLDVLSETWFEGLRLTFLLRQRRGGIPLWNTFCVWSLCSFIGVVDLSFAKSKLVFERTLDRSKRDLRRAVDYREELFDSRILLVLGRIRRYRHQVPISHGQSRSTFHPFWTSATGN